MTPTLSASEKRNLQRQADHAVDSLLASMSDDEIAALTDDEMLALAEQVGLTVVPRQPFCPSRDWLTTCNSCEAAPMVDGDPRGYCADCGAA